jgi:hypothetical protein
MLKVEFFIISSFEDSLTEPLGVYIACYSEKSFAKPKSISLILVISSLFFNIKFSGLISLKLWVRKNRKFQK